MFYSYSEKILMIPNFEQLSRLIIRKTYMMHTHFEQQKSKMQIGIVYGLAILNWAENKRYECTDYFRCQINIRMGDLI